MSKPKLIRVAVSLPEHEHKVIKSVADKERRSISMMINIIVAKWLQEQFYGDTP